MAKLSTAAIFPLLSVLLFFVITATALGGGKVGGRKPVKNVETNKEVQDLGRYCVQEYNHWMQKGNGSKLLVFSQVVKAETQVVSGIKYYLKISTTTHDRGASRTYEAVVVVKPWLKSKELVEFKPSTPPTNTK